MRLLHLCILQGPHVRYLSGDASHGVDGESIARHRVSLPTGDSILSDEFLKFPAHGHPIFRVIMRLRCSETLIKP